jgi:hypothetical protein
MSKILEEEKYYKEVLENSKNKQKTVSLSTTHDAHEKVKNLAKELNVSVSEIYTMGAKTFMNKIECMRKEIAPQ